jgi:Beta-lactamase class C and other penicillin binding proteins
MVKDGKLIERKYYGLASVEHGVPVTAKTVFRLASVSKQMLTVATMLLARDGKLDINDSIAKYLDEAPSSWAPITIRHLMTHTSGLPREPPGFDASKIQSDADILKSAYSVPLASAPGDQWEYSNTGYFALGEIVHEASGQPWMQFVRTRVFATLGMNDTTAADFGAVVPNTAVGYRYTAGQLRHTPPQFALRASGAFMSTLEDMLKMGRRTE